MNAVNGLAALRNSVGDAHGKGMLDASAATTHATLAVNLAGTISLYLLATWQEQHPPVQQPPAEPIDDFSDVPF
jgi:hypothetical protein